MADKGIILFDCDGTLVDSEMLSSTACVAALEGFGLSYAQKPFADEFIGVHLSIIIEILNARHGVDIAYDAFVDAYRAQMLRLVPQEIKILDTTRDYIRDLHARGYRMAVGSNGVREVVLAELEATGILQYFDVVITADDVPNPKPAPDMYLAGMRALGGDTPESVFVLEDSVPGLKAAIAAGMIPVGYTGLNHMPAQTAEMLRKAGAHAVLDHLQGLDSLLK